MKEELYSKRKFLSEPLIKAKDMDRLLFEYRDVIRLNIKRQMAINNIKTYRELSRKSKIPWNKIYRFCNYKVSQDFHFSLVVELEYFFKLPKFALLKID